MTTVRERYASASEWPLIICDFSPPRGADQEYLAAAATLDADFICVGYNPGKAVRVDSAVAAYAINQHTRKEVIFNLASRDMNKLALETHLLGAAVLGLENVVVIEGDRFTEKERADVTAVRDFRPAGLISAIKQMNDGTDYKGTRLRNPTRFCVGAAVDLSKQIGAEAQLAHKKAEAGADFFVTQSVYDVEDALRFRDEYRSSIVQDTVPVFYGIQVLDKEGLVFGNVPLSMKKELENGRAGWDITLELIHRFVASGLMAIYLIPPILRGGRRDYKAAQRVLAALPRGSR